MSKLSLGFAFVLCASCSIAVAAAAPDSSSYRFRVAVTTPLEFRNVPVDPMIDFGANIREAGVQGVLDPNSIQVLDLVTGEPVPHAEEGFAYGDRGRVEWVIADPNHVEYEIRFRVTKKRCPLEPKAYTPLIGVGDLLRYNAGQPRPITLFYAAGFVDLTGDGRSDLVGCWNYAYRPGGPWDGIICYPRTGGGQRKGGPAAVSRPAATAHALLFGDLVHLRYVEQPDSTDFQHFRHTYMAADFADFNGDGLVDLVQTRRGTKSATIYLNTGRRDAGGMPVFTASVSVAVPGWKACRAVDLNGDGALDLVVDGQFIRNTNPKGWPLTPAAPVKLDAGREPCFFDVDQDGRLDAVCLQGGAVVQPDGYRIAWRRNVGGDPPRFGPEERLAGIDPEWCTLVAAADDGERSGLLVQHDVFQNISFFERISSAGEEPRFQRRGRAESISAVLSLGDQAWPCVCDWDGDGDLDLLVGGGYGWPRIVINEGTTSRPAYAEPMRILADGEPIRFLRDDILGEPHHWHNMGYPYPDYVDWDGDGLADLVCPNETNRIFWYKNVGTRRQPEFGARQQIIVDGFPDSPQARRRSAELAAKATYPTEEDRPFFWRTAAAIADFNGDGLMDLVTLTGNTRQAALFAQYRDAYGKLRVRRDRILRLADGRPIDDRIVRRKAHWTEGFRAIDWDGDGLMDLIYSLAGSHGGIQDHGSIYLLRNCGTKTRPKFEEPQTMQCFGEPIRITNHGPQAWPCDFDRDGKPDLVTCVEWSVYPVYRHAALMMPERPHFRFGKLKPCGRP